MFLTASRNGTQPHKMIICDQTLILVRYQRTLQVTHMNYLVMDNLFTQDVY